MDSKTLMATVTGEPFQPVRLHYELRDLPGLEKAFRRLRCVQRDAPRGRWVWLYDHEAKALPLQKRYRDLPRHLRPVVLGSFYVRGQDQLLLDVRSCERAEAAVPFFDRHIPRAVAKVINADIVNQLFESDPNLTPESLFDREKTAERDPEAMIAVVRESVAQIADPQEKLRVGLEVLEADARRPLPKIERFPVHFYEDGLGGFVLAMKLRQMVAMQHWLGHTEYNLNDVMQLVLGK